MEIIQLDIDGMTCASCVAHVEKGLKKLDGVEIANVNLANEKATVSYDPRVVSVADLLKGVQASGYGAVEHKAEEEAKNAEKKGREIRNLGIQTAIAGLLSFPLVLAMVAGIGKIEVLMFLHDPWLQFALATPVQFIFGARFYSAAWRSLRAGSPNMDVLVALGTTAAYVFSLYTGFVVPELALGLYFEVSAIVLTLVLLGNFFEAKAKGRASEAIKKLMGLQAKTALVVREGQELEVPVDDVMVGDVVLVRPGDRIPVDGTVVSGRSTIDESALTGESMPVEKELGDGVMSGSINGSGSIQFEATKVGSESVLARIIAVVEEAQGSKAPIQQLADRVAAVFVPVVLGIAALTLVLWLIITGSLNDGLIAAVTVLVIACPCALGLATPTAIMVGTGLGASKGILIKNGEVLQKAGSVSAVILDKTGTVTKGKPELQKILVLEGAETPEEQVLELAAALEKQSEHPLAMAIVRAAVDRGLVAHKDWAVDNFEALGGKGVVATVDGREYVLGTRELLSSRSLDLDAVDESMAQLERQGMTVVALGSDRPLALFAIADGIKEGSTEAVAQMKEAGLEVFMITGDNERTARAIAAQGGIDKVFASVLPEGKSAHVEQLQKRGYTVAMVGDGINDAPALVTADVGIAMASGTDIAMESADIALMAGDLRDVVRTMVLSDKTMGKIRQNLFWAYFYNSLGIPFAALGLLSPIIAGAAMAFSSVSVVSNSLRLNGLDLDKARGPWALRRKAKAQKRGTAPKGQEEKSKEDPMVTIKVEGMSCGHCKASVEKAAGGVEGVVSAAVNLEAGELSIDMGRSGTSEILEEVRAAVKEAGYNPLTD